MHNLVFWYLLKNEKYVTAVPVFFRGVYSAAGWCHPLLDEAQALQFCAVPTSPYCIAFGSLHSLEFSAFCLSATHAHSLSLGIASS